MMFNLLCCLVWFSCILSMNNGSPLSENKTAVADISSNFYEQSDESISEGSKLREKRHISQYLGSFMMPPQFQKILKSIFVKPLVQMNTNGTLMQMGNVYDILRMLGETFYASLLQNWVKQVQSAFNQIFGIHR